MITPYAYKFSLKSVVKQFYIRFKPYLSSEMRWWTDANTDAVASYSYKKSMLMLFTAACKLWL